MDKVRLMVVDDHTVFRESLSLLLQTREDFEVVAGAADGRAAVREASAARPDVILMDLAMPDMNGVEATRRILKHHPQSKVIVLTMYADPDYVRQALEAGVRGYLVKSVESTVLFQAIDSVLAGEYYLCPAVSEVVVKGFVSASGNGHRRPRRGGDGRLTPREEEVLKLLAEGLHKSQIADKLCISVRTVEAHRAHVQEKLGAKTLAELVRFAVRHHLVEP